MSVTKRCNVAYPRRFSAKLLFLVLLISICVPATTNAQVYNWGPIPVDNVFHNVFNWTPFGFPDSTSKAAVIDYEQGIYPKLFNSVNLGGLTINAYGSFDQNGHALNVNPGPAGYIGRTNIKRYGEMWARSGNAFDTQELTIDGVLRNRQGLIQVDTSAEILPNGELEGHGIFQMAGSQPLINNGLVRSNGVNKTLTINRYGSSSSSFNWDGDGEEAGELEVGVDSTLRIDMPVTDAFSNTIRIREGGVLRVDPNWTLGSDGDIRMDGGQIHGGDVTVSAWGRIESRHSSRIDSNLTINNYGRLNVISGFLQLTGNVTLLGPSAGVRLSSDVEVVVDELVDNDGGWIGSQGGSILGEVNVRDGGTVSMTDGNLNLEVLDLDPGSLFVFTGGRMVVNLVEGNLDIAGGTLAIGVSPGLMTVEGHFSQMAGATLEIELGGIEPGGQYDQMTVTGDVSLDGSLAVQLIEPFVLEEGQQFTIVQATGNVTGQFADLADGDLVGNFNGVDLFIRYEDHSVSLYTEADIIVGDVNVDGVVDFLDIEPFVELLANGGFQEEADINEDGVVDFLDIEPFVALLGG